MKKAIKKPETTGAKLDMLSDMIESLAISTAKGFATTATKDDIKRLEDRMIKVESDHAVRLDKHTDDIRILKTAFEKNLKIKLAK